MNQISRPQAGAPLAAMTVARAGGGEIRIGTAAGWQMLVVYRGKHCPLCRKYLGGLNGMLDQFQALGIEVLAVSADTREKAEHEVGEEEWRFPVGYGLSQDQMRQLGVYISHPRSAAETDRPFPEPGLFIANPQGLLQIVDISNAPFARPDLQALLDGLKFLFKNDYPIRGTAA